MSARKFAHSVKIVRHRWTKASVDGDVLRNQLIESMPSAHLQLEDITSFITGLSAVTYSIIIVSRILCALPDRGSFISAELINEINAF